MADLAVTANNNRNTRLLQSEVGPAEVVYRVACVVRINVYKHKHSSMRFYISEHCLLTAPHCFDGG